MAGYLTTHGADSVLAGTAMPTTLYAQGHTANPTVDATANVAVETRRLTLTLAAPLAGVAVNDGPATLNNAAATENWTHLTLWDAETDGDPWWVMLLSVPAEIVTGDVIRLALGALSLSFELWS